MRDTLITNTIISIGNTIMNTRAITTVITIDTTDNIFRSTRTTKPSSSSPHAHSS